MIEVHGLGSFLGGVAELAIPSSARGEDPSTSSTTAGTQAEIQRCSHPNQVRDLPGHKHRRDGDGMGMRGLQIRSATQGSSRTSCDVKELSVAGRGSFDPDAQDVPGQRSVEGFGIS